MLLVHPVRPEDVVELCEPPLLGLLGDNVAAPSSLYEEGVVAVNPRRMCVPCNSLRRNELHDGRVDSYAKCPPPELRAKVKVGLRATNETDIGGIWVP